MVLGYIQRPMEWAFEKAELGFDVLFGRAWNPLFYLGALCYFNFWIVAASGIYLYIVFETSVLGAYNSIEAITQEQWYFGGIMRSLHRYASDALMLTTMIHLLREFALDRYRGVRWFSWVVGVPMLWLLIICGINGYWLVWDELAQMIAVWTAEFLDWFPIFGEPIARNFLTKGSLGDRFFSLLIFLHIALPLILLLLMWIHLQRMNRARINPPMGLAIGTFLMLLVLSLIYPAVSHPQADLSHVPEVIHLDWFYLFVYPMIDLWSAGPVWALIYGVTGLLIVMPWLPKEKYDAPAVVNPDQCNGCERCFDDCPYGAVIMQLREDDSPYEKIAVVNADACAACGICVGSCPTHTPLRRGDHITTGIDLPDLSLHQLRGQCVASVAGLPDDTPKVILFGCARAVQVEAMNIPGVATVELPCTGMVPPSLLDFMLRRGGADGVFLTGCGDGECFHRLGGRWVEERLDGTRETYLRTKFSKKRIRLDWASSADGDRLKEDIIAFRDSLPGLPDESDLVETNGVDET